MKNKCPFFDPKTVDAPKGYGDKPGWCIEQDAPCPRNFLCQPAKMIQQMDIKLQAMHEALKAAKEGLTLAKDFISAGFDGMTGGYEDYCEIKRSIRVVNKALKLKQ